MITYVFFRNAVHSEVHYVVGDVSTNFLFELKIPVSKTLVWNRGGYCDNANSYVVYKNI